MQKHLVRELSFLSSICFRKKCEFYLFYYNAIFKDCALKKSKLFISTFNLKGLQSGFLVTKGVNSFLLWIDK